MNEDYYHEQNSCYDSNSFGFDQFQPPQYTVNHPIFNSQNDVLNAIQKQEEQKRIGKEQAAKERYWKIPICDDDDEDNTTAITPVLPIEEPDNPLSMGDKHLDTIPETESDEVIKSSVEDLVPIPSESEGIPDSVCDVPLCENTTPLNALNEHYEIVVDYNDDSTSSDDDSPYGENIDYVDASPPDDEIVSLDFTYVVWIFLAFLTYPVVPPYLLSTRNEDTIFDPGISIYHSSMPDVSHRSGTFMKFNVYPNRLNESPMMILSSMCSPMDQ
ncbi:hypothetical protein Tco_1535857 [Tanacetum coccineum]